MSPSSFSGRNLPGVGLEWLQISKVWSPWHARQDWVVPNLRQQGHRQVCSNICNHTQRVHPYVVHILGSFHSYRFHQAHHLVSHPWAECRWIWWCLELQLLSVWTCLTPNTAVQCIQLFFETGCYHIPETVSWNRIVFSPPLVNLSYNNLRLFSNESRKSICFQQLGL